MTGKEPIAPMTYRQTGDNTSRVATPKDLSDSQHQHFLIFHEGLTIRQHFAAMAMQGLCASGFFTEPKLQKQSEQFGSNISIALAISAVDIADSLIAELNKTTKP